MLRPPQALGGVGAAVIQAPEVQAVGNGWREGVHDALDHVGMQRGECREEALARGWGHGAIDIEPVEGVLDGPEGLDPLGYEWPSAHGQSAQTAFVLAEHAHRAGLG